MAVYLLELDQITLSVVGAQSTAITRGAQRRLYPEARIGSSSAIASLVRHAPLTPNPSDVEKQRAASIEGPIEIMRSTYLLLSCRLRIMIPQQQAVDLL